jgi:hypothetical protein
VPNSTDPRLERVYGAIIINAHRRSGPVSATLFSLVFAHLLCNALAADQLLPPREAYFCSANFEDLKVALNPDLTREAFDRLGSVERAQVSVDSYRHYTAWLAQNASIVTVMHQSIGPLVKSGSPSRPAR